MEDNVDSFKPAKSCSEPEDPEYSGSLDEGEDDEATLEEEESQENSSDVADEIDELQKVRSITFTSVSSSAISLSTCRKGICPSKSC